MNEVALTDDLVPANARKLATIGIEHGWTPRLTHVHQDDDTDSIAVRLFARHNSAWAIWIDGRFDSGASRNPLTSLKYRDLIALITQPLPDPRSALE